MKISVLVSRPCYTEDQLQRLRELGEVQVVEAQKSTPQQVIQLVSDAEILIAGASGIDHLSKEIFAGLKHLKFVSTLTVGYDWVDVQAAREHGIPISTVKGATSESVAEHTWGMILDLAKRITEFNRDLLQKNESRFGLYQGKEVYGKTLGIIGSGHIGKKVARIAHGFEMKVLGINESGKAVDGVSLVSLDELLAQSDVIAVCVPLTEKTRDLIGAQQIDQMKNGVTIVNCSREHVVNKEAIVEAVKTGKVFGYGVETEIGKPLLPNDLYATQARILVTPHNAFNTLDAEIKTFEMVIENVKAYLDGQPQNVVS